MSDDVAAGGAEEAEEQRAVSPSALAEEASAEAPAAPLNSHSNTQGFKEGDETIELDRGSVAYLIGRNGATKLRLQNFSGCEIAVNDGADAITIRGDDKQKERARLCIKVTLQQKDGGQIHIDFEELAKRAETATVDVPSSAVGLYSENDDRNEVMSHSRVTMPRS